MVISLYGQTAAGCILRMQTERWGRTVRRGPAAAGSSMCWFKKIKAIAHLESCSFQSCNLDSLEAQIARPRSLHVTRRQHLSAIKREQALLCFSKWEISKVFLVSCPFLIELMPFQTYLQWRFASDLQIPKFPSACLFTFVPVAELKTEQTLKQRNSYESR